jgi:hypothetical protein
MRIWPTRDISRGVDAVGVCFEKFVHENAAIDYQSSLFRERQTGPHADASNHEFCLERVAAREHRPLTVDGGDSILEIEFDPMLFMQPERKPAAG